jgi:hypothetical protein
MAVRSAFYYTLKPYLPWRIRMGLRRLMARRARQTAQARWPIDQTAAQSPTGWPGWPEGKRFAFVLTHDVESAAGHDKCWRLADLEAEMGFRSSYNFVPEGHYAVRSDLRGRLVQSGFEVGIHDLHHDGKLFRSEKQFSRDAGRINHYVREWKAAGFRAGFMLRNLDWYHQLDIAYDASTFDTDPFEPQPQGARTIFPFWVPAPLERPESSGYVELPYTLPQDSTLFLLLREKSPEIWMRKLDWVAQHGGMVLVNVHPDYVRFGIEGSPAGTYPVSFYRELLHYVSTRYAGQYWQALPRQVAHFAKAMLRATNHDAPVAAVTGIVAE